MEKGLKKTQELWGEKRTDLLELGELGEYIINIAFGDVYQRDTLGTRDRELITLSLLIAKGNAPEQLKNHMKAALHIGIEIKEIEELILQSAFYVGFPNAINAMKILQKL